MSDLFERNNACYRFHHAAADPQTTARRFLRKRRISERAAPLLISANATHLQTCEGIFPIEHYADLPKGPWRTLTLREADLLAMANPGCRPPLALEQIFPWLPETFYTNDVRRNFKALQSTLRRFGPHLISAGEFCDRQWNRMCNKISFKSRLDERFYTAWHGPVQQAFLLQERRPDRAIIALDFNAMYPSVMQGDFADPASLWHEPLDRPLGAETALPTGLYRCRLGGRVSDFIRRHNPFRSFFAGRYLQADLSQPLTVDLHEFELAFYRRHFSEIHLIDAVRCKKTIPHPLAREALRCLARRRHYDAQGNPGLAAREKYHATLLASATQRPGLQNRLYWDAASLETELSQRFGIDLQADGPEGLSASWLQGRKNITVRPRSDGLELSTPRLDTSGSCFLFQQTIVARGRTVLMSMMERLATIVPDAEICYANVDSIHLSIPRHDLPQVLGQLQTEASVKAGGFKIEAVARHGLWLEPGRYWLYDEQVIKFRNRSISARGDAFADHSVYLAQMEFDGLSIPQRIHVTMEGTMSQSYRHWFDDRSGLERQDLCTNYATSSPDDTADRLASEGQEAVMRKMHLFHALREELSGPAASGPGNIAG